MGARLSIGLDRRRLRVALAVFFLALAVPSVVLVQQAYGQLKWEAFHQHRALAEELATRIDTRLVTLVRVEEARSFADYAFLTVAGDPAANLLQRSPLAAWPVPSQVPGLVGHFQVDSDGRLSSPLLPAAGAGPTGVSAPEFAQRRQRVAFIEQVLAVNRLVQAAMPASIDESDRSPMSPAVSLDRASEQSLRADGPAAAPVSAAPTLAGTHEASVASEARPENSAELVAGERRAAEAAVLAERRQSAARVATDAASSAVAAAGDKAQAAFDQLSSGLAGQLADGGASIGRVEDLALRAPYAISAEQETAEPARTRASRKEQVSLPEALPAERQSVSQPLTVAPLAITTFESELDPFEFSLLGSGHFVLYRKVWRDGQRFIQGLLIEQRPFLEGVLAEPFRAVTLARSTDLTAAWRGEVLAVFGGQPERAYLSSTAELAGALLYRTRLSAPLADLELLYSVRRLPVGAGAAVIGWSASVLALVVVAGFLLMYRAGCRQIDLARQQQDFVAAVSHELKTPLTSIRMYGEMLRAGWVGDETKRRGYYDYIVEESERLSRLIGNVLQLARMTRNDIRPQLVAIPVPELAERLRTRVGAQVERAGFALTLECDPRAAAARVLVDEDFVSQIVINLVDNALKFATGAERRAVHIGFQAQSDRRVRLLVRDFGPGVPRGQMKRIFRLFYRAEAELTRETVGTGIGLALVRELARAMDASVDVVNAEPGAEFRVSLRTVAAGLA